MNSNGKWAVQGMVLVAGLALAVPGMRQVFGSDPADAAMRSRRIVGELRPVAFGTTSANVAELHRRGWIECDGQVLHQSAFPELYGAIGDTWGGATKGEFRLPDLRRALLKGIPTDRELERQKELLGGDYIVGRPSAQPERSRPEHAEVSYFIYAGREVGGGGNVRG